MSSLSPKYLSALLFSVFLLLVSGCGSSGSSDSGDNVVPPLDAPPTIDVLGSNPHMTLIGNSYTAVSPGAEAYDAEDGNITAKIIETNDVNDTVAGTYATTYMVTDLGGNTVTASRIELVIDPGAEFMYEDAEDNNTLGWFNFDNDPVGATIANIDDGGNRVIQLNTAGTTNGFELRFERYDGTFVDWNDGNHSNLAMDINYTSGEEFKVTVKCDTDAGLVWVTYANYPKPASDPNVWVEINSSLSNSDVWESFSTADWGNSGLGLDAVIFDDNNSNTLNQIDGLRLKGTMRVDNIRTLP